MTKKLIASAANIPNLQNSLNEYYYSKRYVIDPHTLAISNDKLGGDKVTALKLFVKPVRGGFRLYQNI